MSIVFVAYALESGAMFTGSIFINKIDRNEMEQGECSFNGIIHVAS